MDGEGRTSGRQGRLSDQAYDLILESLFARRLPVGAFVSQNDLVELLCIPVAPLRDALRMLESEGVLTIHPRSGIQFVKPGLELTRSTYQFRSIVERAAVRVYAETADLADIQALLARHRSLIDRIAGGVFDAEVVAGLDTLETDLHGGIVGILRNPLIDTSYRRMHNYLRMVRLDRRFTSPIALRTLREHVEVLVACEARDASAAEAAIAAHFAAALQRMIGFL